MRAIDYINKKLILTFLNLQIWAGSFYFSFLAFIISTKVRFCLDKSYLKKFTISSGRKFSLNSEVRVKSLFIVLQWIIMFVL